MAYKSTNKIFANYGICQGDRDLLHSLAEGRPHVHSLNPLFILCVFCYIVEQMLIY